MEAHLLLVSFLFLNKKKISYLVFYKLNANDQEMIWNEGIFLLFDFFVWACVVFVHTYVCMSVYTCVLVHVEAQMWCWLLP